MVGCARGVAVDALDASTSGVTGSDAGAADAAQAKDAGMAGVDAAPIDPDETTLPDAGMADAGVDEAAQCAATNLCVTPRMAGDVSGDTGSDTLEVSGSTSMFVLVNVSEDDSVPLIPKRVRVGASLNSPGADFDLFLHASGCASVLDASEAGFTEAVDLTWQDTQAQDDGRTLILEVRHKAGICDVARPWTLSIRGN